MEMQLLEATYKKAAGPQMRGDNASYIALPNLEADASLLSRNME